MKEQEAGINLKIIDKEGEKSAFIRHGRDGIDGRAPVSKKVKFGKRDKCCHKEIRCLNCDKLINSTIQNEHKMKVVKDNVSSTKFQCPKCAYSYIRDNEAGENLRKYEQDYGNE